MRIRAFAFFFGAASLGSVWAVAPHARADSVSSALSWTRMPGADSCVSTRELARAVEARIGHSVFVSPADAELSVEGRIEPAPDGFRAVVTATRSNGEVAGARELHTARDCSSLTDAVALVIALLIDPDAGQGPRPRVTEPTVTVRTIVRRERVVVRVPPPPWHAAARLSGLAGLGIVPGVALGGRLALELTPPNAWTFVARGSLFAAGESSDTPGVRVGLVSAGLVICPRFALARGADVAPCAGVDALFYSAETVGVDPASEATAIAAAIVLRLELQLRLVGPLVAHAALEGLAPVPRPELMLTRSAALVVGGADAQVELYEPWPIEPLAEVGVGLAF